MSFYHQSLFLSLHNVQSQSLIYDNFECLKYFSLSLSLSLTHTHVYIMYHRTYTLSLDNLYSKWDNLQVAKYTFLSGGQPLL